ncbi:MAG TPA: phosphatase PAP2 family protein [Patescibacteria group bacterium]|nr:phosphatase PAP2 family protein [Patescibacteria group bacterium]
MNSNASMDSTSDKTARPKRRKTRDLKLREILSMVDIYMLGMITVYSILAIFVRRSPTLLFLNSIFAAGVITIAVAGAVARNPLFKFIRSFSIVPITYLMYDQAQNYIRSVNPHDIDYLLIAIDKWIFGVNPTQWLSNFTHPWLTEYLQFTYMCFFFMPIAQAIELHIEGNRARFKRFARTIAFGFFLSYLLYFFTPAIGPRFTLHDFALLNTELPGVWLTEKFREVVNAGAGLTTAVHNAAEIVNRDCMPSGHTMMTLLNMMLAYRYQSRLRWVFYIIGSSLILSTVYLRYHYVIDVISGIGWALVVWFIEPKIRMWVKSKGFIHA